MSLQLLLVLWFTCSVNLAEKVDIVVEQSFGKDYERAGVLKGQIRKDGYPQGQWIFERDPLSSESKKQFIDAVKNNGYYMIRFPSNPTDPKSRPIQSFTKASCLAGSTFEEQLIIHADIKANFFALEYHLSQQNCSVQSLDESKAQFKSESVVSFQRPRMASDLNREFLFRSQEDLMMDDPILQQKKMQQGQQQQTQQEGESEGEEGKKPPEEEKSWWQKNWWFIVILGVLYMQVMNSVTGAGQQGQGPQQQAPAATGRRR
eukprot:TRINITY_DN2512_c0_g1_i1.p1 TRINITY_DN2512_c0_g1~~TRINITY_DN2512_c0_g1_i1.p1  ORF type:complete len:261 (-),score=32.43 TRINITY_DN2512_c0_g1_i1:440-1222(-)